MIATNGKILVRVNLKQKDETAIDGVVLKMANSFNANYRERSPVLAEVVEPKEPLKKGDIIVCHHNHFYDPSPYHVQDDLYSIPFNHTIFAKVTKKGNLKPLFGNILGERIVKKTELELPPEHQEKYIDRIKITDKGWTSYDNGSVVITRKNAPYDIVYNFNGIERTITKIPADQICAILK